MTQASANRLALRACLLALLLALPGQAALAFAIASSTLTISDLTITPTSVLTPTETRAASGHVFNSLGQEGSIGFIRAGTDVMAGVKVDFARGSAEALPSMPGRPITASGFIDIPGGNVLAGVTEPGSTADLIGSFDILGANTVTFSMQIDFMLRGSSDASGFLQTDDITAELYIDDVRVLFDFHSLLGLPSIPGINNYPDMPIHISQPLTTDVALAAGTHTFRVHADAEAQASNMPMVEPGSLPLLLAGLGVLAWHRSGSRSLTNNNKIGRRS